MLRVHHLAIHLSQCRPYSTVLASSFFTACSPVREVRTRARARARARAPAPAPALALDLDPDPAPAGRLALRHFVRGPAHVHPARNTPFCATISSAPLVLKNVDTAHNAISLRTALPRMIAPCGWIRWIDRRPPRGAAAAGPGGRAGAAAVEAERD